MFEEKSSPTLNSEKSLFRPPAIALLRAVGVPASLTGAAHCITCIKSCVKAAADLWPSEILKQWFAVTVEMEAALQLAPRGNASNLHLFTKSDNVTLQFEQFLHYRQPILSEGQSYEAYGLLGKALLIAASRNEELPKYLLSGLQTLKNARQTKGKRSKDWDQLLGADLKNTRDLQRIKTELPHNSPTQAFIASAIAALASSVVSAEFVGRTQPSITQSTELTDPPALTNATKSPIGSKGSAEENQETAEENVAPDIASRIAGADYTSFAEKLGLPHRDQMLPADLAPITRKLRKTVETGAPRERGFAVLAIASLVTGCTDEAGLELRFRPDHNIWLDMEKGSWAWDFAFFRKSRETIASSHPLEPVYCPFPELIVEPIRAAMDRQPTAKTLRDLILCIQGADHFDLKGFRVFLRSCGHPSHPPHRGRFARSLPAVYLQETGSDMTTALLTGFQASTAPAALFYFGPLYTTLTSRAADVYEFLGLGAPSILLNESGRVGCQKLLETKELKTNWLHITRAISVARGQALACRSEERLIECCNLWMSLLCAGFVIQSAHRGTRLECLTAGALLTHPDAMLIHDKDEGGRVQPRLIPKTSTIKKILLCASECRMTMESLKTSNLMKARVCLEASDPFFVQWTLINGIATSTVLSTGEIAKHMAKFFKSEVNFGRSQWVTYLDEDGSDRWLTRSLTGHTRDVTRTHGPYFNIPPLIVARRLCVEMEKTGQRIFGQTELDIGIFNLPLVKPSVIRREVDSEPASNRIPDPRTILPPLAVETLSDWYAVTGLSSDLMAGHIDAPPSVLAVLHLLMIDIVPFPIACIKAITDPANGLRVIHNCAGLQWKRSHFIHPNWYPMRDTTAALIAQIDTLPSTEGELIKLVCAAIRTTQYFEWPSTDAACWNALSALPTGFRRLSFSPAMCAVSSPLVAAPCLSEFSNNRLAGAPTAALNSAPVARRSKEKTLQKSADVDFLIKTLGKYSSPIVRLGEQRARAVKCLRDLESPDISWTDYGLWLKTWIIDELKLSRNYAKDCYQISSMQTYLSTLLVARKTIDFSVDPADWEDDEWIAWLSMTDSSCYAEAHTSSDPEGKTELHPRCKSAVAAIVESLKRRRQYVPASIVEKLRLSQKLISPFGSASSHLITDADHIRTLEIIHKWHAEFPADCALVEARVKLSQSVPLRAADISSLTTLCITPGDGLVIERVGYNSHKTENAIRIAPLSEIDAKLLREKIVGLESYFGERFLLFRGDGSIFMGKRDQRLCTDWSAALKEATGDAKARPHSVRAATLQEIAWPGWQQICRQLINHEATPGECQAWLNTLQEDWMRLSRAVAMAGQGDLRSALGHYLAGWLMVYAVMANARLQDQEPGPTFLIQLGLKPEAMRQSRSRLLRRPEDASCVGEQWDAWHWISLQLIKRNSKSVNPRPTDQVEVAEGLVETPIVNVIAPLTSDAERLTYLTVRALGYSKEEALEVTEIGLSTAMELEGVLPPEESVASAVKRGRQGPRPRGSRGNIEMALSEKGGVVLAWLRAMKSPEYLIMRQVFFRDEPERIRLPEKFAFWSWIAASLPPEISIHVRIGNKHLSPADISTLTQLAPAVKLFPDPRIGERPIVSLFLRNDKNLVISARLTAVARSYCLAIDSISNLKNQGDSNAS